MRLGDAPTYPNVFHPLAPGTPTTTPISEAIPTAPASTSFLSQFMDFSTPYPYLIGGALVLLLVSGGGSSTKHRRKKPSGMLQQFIKV